MQRCGAEGLVVSPFVVLFCVRERSVRREGRECVRGLERVCDLGSQHILEGDWFKGLVS